MNESCRKWMSHVTHMGLSRGNPGECKRVMSQLNESCHNWMSHNTNEWVMSLETMIKNVHFFFSTFSTHTHTHNLTRHSFFFPNVSRIGDNDGGSNCDIKWTFFPTFSTHTHTHNLTRGLFIFHSCIESNNSGGPCDDRWVLVSFFFSFSFFPFFFLLHRGQQQRGRCDDKWVLVSFFFFFFQKHRGQ